MFFLLKVFYGEHWAVEAMIYKPDEPLNSSEWLSLDEAERISLVKAHHNRIKTELPNATLHAAIHVTIENQLAEGIPEVQDAMVRLVKDGIDRHEVIHAIGSVLAKHIFNIAKGQTQGIDSNRKYLEDLSTLTVESWKKEAR